MGKYEPFGPFELPLHGKFIDDLAKREFWKTVESLHPNIAKTVGCYIFAIKKKGTIVPWYVGKSERRLLKDESWTDHKKRIYEKALHESGSGSIPLLYLLAKQTKTGKFRKIATKMVSDAKFLENLLIEKCFLRNKQLSNKSQTKHIRGVVVPGLWNDNGEKRSTSAHALASLVGPELCSRKD